VLGIVRSVPFTMRIKAQDDAPRVKPNVNTN
jgi:hypothetical protein